jgi:hypothetical protein
VSSPHGSQSTLPKWRTASMRSVVTSDLTVAVIHWTSGRRSGHLFNCEVVRLAVGLACARWRDRLRRPNLIFSCLGPFLEPRD